MFEEHFEPFLALLVLGFSLLSALGFLTLFILNF